jgi:thiol-disulfide isomerase/thioredoxin
MKIYLILVGFFLLIFTTSCQSDAPIKDTQPVILKEDISEPKEIVDTNEVAIPVYDFKGFEPFLSIQDDQVHVVNFWATWCVPCVAELPYFEKLNSENPAVEVLLVSLDFKKFMKDKLIPFIIENNIKSKVILLDDPDGNNWIPQVDESWSGAIPATVIYNKNKSAFYEGSFTEESLNAEVQKFLN